MKESDAFVLLPGGFGTLDEAFELLTLLQTGKAQPAPIVLLDVPGGTYWQQLAASSWRPSSRAHGYISPEDLDLVLITDDVDDAVDEVHRLLRATTTRCGSSRATSCCGCSTRPTTVQLAALNAEFADIVAKGQIETTGATQDRDRGRGLPRARPGDASASTAAAGPASASSSTP